MNIIINEESEQNKGIINDFINLFSSFNTSVNNVCPGGLSLDFTIQKVVSSETQEIDYLAMGDDQLKVGAFLNYISKL